MPYTCLKIQKEMVVVSDPPSGINRRIGPEALNTPVKINTKSVFSVDHVSGRTICTSSLNGPQPSSFAASNTSVGIRLMALLANITFVEKPVQMQYTRMVGVAVIGLFSKLSVYSIPSQSQIAPNGPVGCINA